MSIMHGSGFPIKTDACTQDIVPEEKTYGQPGIMQRFYKKLPGLLMQYNVCRYRVIVTLSTAFKLKLHNYVWMKKLGHGASKCKS